SVVETGVKYFGCENSTHQDPPIQSWKRILPSVVSVSKSGAVSPIASAMSHLPMMQLPPVCPDETDVAARKNMPRADPGRLSENCMKARRDNQHRAAAAIVGKRAQRGLRRSNMSLDTGVEWRRVFHGRDVDATRAYLRKGFGEDVRF